jgi:CubicO group peptidase (beta-lactamase class C family)
VKLTPRPLVVAGLIVSACVLAAGPGAPALARQQPRAGGRAASGVEALVARLREIVPALMAQAAVPGAQIAVIGPSGGVGRASFGLANTDTKTAVTDASVFEAASLSKPVFAYAVLTLVDAGLLDLDTPISKYLPGRYDVGDDARLDLITPRHVLSHRSGFPNWRSGSDSLKIHFTPGDRFSYSGEGFVYLAAAVERITGQTLEAFMRRTVFDPLGMTSSSYVWQSRYELLKVYNHGLLGDLAGRRTPWRANAAASLHTTAGDYARFVEAVLAGRGLRPETARALMSPQSRPDERGINTATAPPTGRPAAGVAWGLGWGLEQEGEGWLIWHWGDNGTTKAYVAASPQHRTGVVLFANSENGLLLAPPIVAEVLGGDASAFAWLKQRGPVPAFGPFLATLRSSGAGQALETYRAGRQARPSEPAIDEETMNRIGYVLLRGKKVKDAIEVFKQNVADHPASWNVFDSLGEAYAADGQTALAIQCYETSLKLNPDNTGGAEALKKLRTGAGRGGD